jgi:MFS family permease
MVGLLIAADGVGTLLGAALTPRLSRRLGTARVMLWAGLGGALTALLMPVGAGWLGMLCFALGYGGFAVGVVVLSINTRTYRQTASPPELLSRVMATVRFVSWGAIPLGSVAAGALATVAGVREALLAACVLALTPLLILWFSPVRRLRDLDDHPEHASRLR